MKSESNDEIISIDFQCVNCDKLFLVSKRSQLYCSPHCGQFATAVRYIRARIKDGTYSNPDIQDAIVFKLKSVYGKKGYYDNKTRRISSELRNKLIERDKGLCCKCKKIGNEVDHINGDSSDMENLQILCHNCHKEKTKLNIVKLSPEDERYSEVGKIRDKLWSRVDAISPECACDDSENWDEFRKQLESEQRQLLKKIKEDVKGTHKEENSFDKEIIAQEINDVTELKSQIESLKLQKQAQIEQILTPEMQARIDAIKLEFANSISSIEENIKVSEAKIMESVLQYGSTVKGRSFQIVWSKGKTTWDTKSLERYAESHPDVLECRKIGKPSVGKLREISKGKR